MSTKDEYVQKMHAKLDQLNAEIDKLVLKADQMLLARLWTQPNPGLNK